MTNEEAVDKLTSQIEVAAKHYGKYLIILTVIAVILIIDMVLLYHGIILRTQIKAAAEQMTTVCSYQFQA